MPDITAITDHEEQALARLLTQLRSKEKIEGLISVIGARAQSIEDVGSDLLLGTMLETAEGAQLDQYGELLGQRRTDESDDRYRALLEARIAILHAKGTSDELLRILSVLADAATVALWEAFPGHVLLEYEGTLTTDDAEWADSLPDLIDQAAAAGVAVTLVERTGTPTLRYSIPGAGYGDGKFGTLIR